jgi:hypothetical protein
MVHIYSPDIPDSGHKLNPFAFQLTKFNFGKGFATLPIPIPFDVDGMKSV